MFAKLSGEKDRFRNVELDNLFITEYMPFAPENYVKTYIAGLSLSGSTDNSADRLASILGTDKADIMEAYAYWCEQGIVRIVSTDPPEVEYLVVKPLSEQIKKFSKTKYASFNDQLSAMLPHRTFLPSEYNEYYSVMEIMHIDVDAMLAIIAYCVRLKGESVAYQYILAVARNLAHQGATSFERVNEKLNELSLYQGELAAIFKALGSRRQPDHNDGQLYVKWTKSLGFSLETIIFVAKNLKKGGMERLDAKLAKYYENHVFTIGEISAYDASRDKLYTLTKEINRILGIYIEQLDYTIETYVNKWLSYGFDENALITIAKSCYARDIRTLSGMDDAVKKFYKEGLLSDEAINGFISKAVSIDEDIKRIMGLAGLSRAVTSWDRDYYRTWTYSWQMPIPLIEYAATLSNGKGNAMAYLNSILASYRERSITTVEDARKMPSSTSEKKSTVTVKSAEEINAIFGHLNPEDI